jgi:hypothetical protein
MIRSHPGDAAISGLAGSAAPSFSPPRALRSLLLLTVTAALGALLLGPLAPATGVPLTSVSDATLWFDQASPAAVAMAVLRLVALGICGYLTLALALTLAADLFDRACGGAGRSHAAIARLLPALLRRFVMGTAQVGLVAVTALPAAASPSGAPPADFHPPATATMTYEGPGAPDSTDPPVATATMTSLGGTSSVPPTATSTMTRLDPTPTETTTETTTTSTTTPPPTSTTTSSTTSTTIAPETAPTSLAPVPIPPEAPAPAAPNDHETWVVSAGDTFWSIAEESLTDWRGSFPPQNDVIRYWRQLIAANQRQLAAPGNPDLLLPGQALVLPSPG